MPDKRGVSAVWANVERATRSKPFLGTTNSLATMQDPKVFALSTIWAVSGRICDEGISFIEGVRGRENSWPLSLSRGLKITYFEVCTA